MAERVVLRLLRKANTKFQITLDCSVAKEFAKRAAFFDFLLYSGEFYSFSFIWA